MIKRHHYKQLFLLLLIISNLIVLGCGKVKKEIPVDTHKKNIRIIPVEAVEVSKSIIPNKITGSSIAMGIKEVYIVAETPGMIETSNITLGAFVTKNTTLLKIEDKIHAAALRQMTDLFGTSKINFETIKKLNESGDESQANLLQARSKLAEAESGVMARARTLAKCSIRSPISGYIAEKGSGLDAGNLVASGKIIARVVNIGKLKTTIFVSEKEIPNIHSGQAATITINALNGIECKGQVTGIGAGSSPGTGAYPVEIIWNNLKNHPIKSGMSVTVSIQTEKNDSTILIPLVALNDDENRTTVFINNNLKAEKRIVKTNSVLDNRIEITSGLSVGELLITSGITTIKAGDSLQITVTGNSGDIK